MEGRNAERNLGDHYYKNFNSNTQRMENEVKLYELQETIEFFGTRYAGETIQLNAKDVAKIEKDYPEALLCIEDEKPAKASSKSKKAAKEDTEE